MKKVELNKTWLQNGLPGVTAAIAQCFSEAAAVCWEHNDLRVPVTLAVDGTVSQTFMVTPHPVTEQMRNGYADLQEAVEWAACAVAFLVIIEETSYTVVKRSWKGTGFDYWLGDKETNEPLFQEKARLEISGILHGNDTDISRRMKDKRTQVSRYGSQLSAVIIAAEFSQPKAWVDSA